MIFEHGDTDGNKIITRKEAEPVIMAAIEAGELGEREAQTIVGILEEADKRGGEDDAAEWPLVRDAAYDYFVHVGDMWQEADDMAREIFDEADADDDHFLSRDEVENALNRHVAEEGMP